MNFESIFAKIDHTILSPTTTWEDIINMCDEGINYGVASICIPPSFVLHTKEYVKNYLNVCTVIGFPNGYNTKKMKVIEAMDAIDSGACEVDMVINLGDLKSKNYARVLDEIKTIKNVVGDNILKVIVETCLLTKDEKIKMCEIVQASGADFIKTSTGFSKSGAKLDDIKLFKEILCDSVKIKASGGISTFEEAALFIDAGAERIGTSKLISIAKTREKMNVM